MTTAIPSLYPLRIDLSGGYSIRRFALYYYDIHYPTGLSFGCKLTLEEAVDFAMAMGRGMMGMPVEPETSP